MITTDPLLQPFQIKHLRLKNRIISTSHEPAYSEDGLPKERYRLYHEEKAKGGIAMTMFGGSTLIAPDSPPVFGNLYPYIHVQWDLIKNSAVLAIHLGDSISCITPLKKIG